MAEEKVLIIIDPQNGFKNKNTEKALSKINEIIDYFDVKFVSLFQNPDSSLYKNLLYWHNFSKHKDKKYFELAIKDNKNLRKIKTHKYGKITSSLKLYLKIHKVKKVYICGLETDACVYKTALDLFDLGITPIVISDACGSCRGKKFHDMGIALSKRQIGEDQVLTFKEIKELNRELKVEILL